METRQNSAPGTKKIVATAKKAIANALLHHRAIGNEIVFWKDGKIVREKLAMPAHTQKNAKDQKNNKMG